MKYEWYFLIVYYFYDVGSLMYELVKRNFWDMFMYWYFEIRNGF